MPKIRILSDRVANQIAAGEVIERPAAVIKELIENALDAGATRIEVEFSHGGRSLMKVEDNGHGMTRDDALLSLERHATSKIAEADDLNRLATFGFRGEALPSIASVSRFTMQTREEGADLGTEVFVNGGKLMHVRDCGRPVGTRIEAAQLFHPVPARRKFLKSDQTEAAHIIQCVRLYALACSRVAFTLLEEGRVVFRSPQCSSLSDRVGEIFGRQIASELMQIQSSDAGLELSGLIGIPGLGRATRHEMITFVNGRPVDSRTLNYALIESYHDSLPKGRYPVAFVFLGLDPAAVDVNVHPAKREVRFRSEPQVRGFVIRSILHRLRELGAASAPSIQSAQAQPQAGPFSAPAPGAAFVPPPALPAALAAPPRPQPPPALAPASGSRPPAAAPAAPVAAHPQPASQLNAWRFIGLAHGAYALFETPAGVVILDRSAAQERIWFERLKEQYGAGPVPCQRLLLAIPLELDPISSALLLDRASFLQDHGFEVAQFGRNFFRIESIPDWMEPSVAESFCRDLLSAFRDGRFLGRAAGVAGEEFARIAASRAVRLPAHASEPEMLSLMRDLFATSMPLTSPAGRPTLVEWSLGDFARRFEK
ncbi:MAG: DNA mismatch repair endonuclease MutL [Opitutaceae bacterium]|jgi:DNA mismatch repair protein MutL